MVHFVMAALGLAGIPVYLAILQRTNQNRLLVLLASQIQINLFTVLLSIGMDALSRHLYIKASNKLRLIKINKHRLKVVLNLPRIRSSVTFPRKLKDPLL